jgi:hypothetical protein
MTDNAIGMLTAIGSIVSALGVALAVVLGYLNRRSALAAKERAEEAAIKATTAASLAAAARSAAEASQAEILLTHGEVVEVGKRIDGRLSELLKSSIAQARAEGRSEGEQAQRDRSRPAES